MTIQEVTFSTIIQVQMPIPPFCFPINLTCGVLSPTHLPCHEWRNVSQAILLTFRLCRAQVVWSCGEAGSGELCHFGLTDAH